MCLESVMAYLYRSPQLIAIFREKTFYRQIYCWCANNHVCKLTLNVIYFVICRQYTAQYICLIFY